jgi:hypothetical protein
MFNLLHSKSANAFEEFFARVLSVVVKALDGWSDWPQTIVSEHRLDVFGVVDENKVVFGFNTTKLNDRPVLFVQLRVQLNQVSKIVLPYIKPKFWDLNI